MIRLEWNEILTLLGMEERRVEEKDEINKQETLLRQLTHLRIESVGEGSRSEVDMFLSEDESFSASVCKAAQCDLSAEDESSESNSNNFVDETVFEDCEEEFDESNGEESLNRSPGEGKEKKSEVETYESEKEDYESQTEAGADDSDFAREEECEGIDRKTTKEAFSSEDNSEDFEGSDLEEAGEEEEEDLTDESDESEDSSSDPSWNDEDRSESSEEEEEDDRSQAKLPSDLSQVDSLSLSVCLSEEGPVPLPVRCGCGGACVRGCPCRTAGHQCSAWCRCHRDKARLQTVSIMNCYTSQFN